MLKSLYPTGHGLYGLTEPDSGSDRSEFLESSKPGLPGSEKEGLLGFFENAITGFARPGLRIPTGTAFLDLLGVVYLNLLRLDYLEVVIWITWN